MTDILDFYAEQALTANRAKKQAALIEKVRVLKQSMQCNCDLDNWQPERSTGHSWVCRIHKAAIR